MKATVFNIQRNSFVDGPGARTTIFLKGCNLNCRWCHNPEGKSEDFQLMVYEEKCIGCKKCGDVCENNLENCVFCGRCVKVCMGAAREVCGYKKTPDEIADICLKDSLLYGFSGGGVTFSGGECMLQADFLRECLSSLKENGIHTAVDTAGNIPFSEFEKIIPFTDLFLYDIKCITEDKHIWGTGVSNRLILDNIKRLSKEFKGEITVRVPIIGGFNDSEDELLKIAEFIKETGIKTVEVVSYHGMYKDKCTALGMDFHEFSVPSKDKIRIFEDMIKK